jgi:hypothetical protein
MESAAAPSLLLALPAACLLQVLQHCADDQCSLLSAARAHSKLHQAAVQALHSIHAVMTQQQQHDSVQLYLSKHSHHVQDMVLKGGADYTLSLDPLPPNLQLYSIQLEGLCLSFAALQDAAMITSLKQLRLSDCRLRDSDAHALAAALPQLPAGLEHLSISRVMTTNQGYHGRVGFLPDTPGYHNRVGIPPAALARLQQLTYLELENVWLTGVVEDSPALQHLQALTRLVDLRLVAVGAEDDNIPASMLSGTQGLTHLQLNLHDCGYVSRSVVEVDLLAGKTLLQHLDLNRCRITDSLDSLMEPDPQLPLAGYEQLPWDGHEQLLSHLQHMQQLTFLDVGDVLDCNLPNWVDSSDEEGEQAEEESQGGPPAAAYAALTASSKLQHLNISSCRMPVGAWQHVLPAGRQLPHLRELYISDIHYATRGPVLCALGSEGSDLVRCCPGLRVLDLQCCDFSTVLQGALPALSGLVSLTTDFNPEDLPQGLESVCQLTGLRELNVSCDDGEGFLLQLTQLKQLTLLEYQGNFSGRYSSIGLADQVGLVNVT